MDNRGLAIQLLTNYTAFLLLLFGVLTSVNQDTSKAKLVKRVMLH